MAIVDNATQAHIDVYRTATKLKAGQSRRICQTPIFGKGRGAVEDSLVGLGNAMVAVNNYGYTIDFATLASPPSVPGVVRVDIDSDGKGCHKVWNNTKVTAPNAGPALSTGNGLLYTYTRKYDNNGLDVWYWTAQDFRTGKVNGNVRSARARSSTPTGHPHHQSRRRPVYERLRRRARHARRHQQRPGRERLTTLHAPSRSHDTDRAANPHARRQPRLNQPVVLDIQQTIAVPLPASVTHEAHVGLTNNGDSATGAIALMVLPANVGGWSGALVGRGVSRHKTTKWPLRTISWATFIVNCIAPAWIVHRL